LKPQNASFKRSKIEQIRDVLEAVKQGEEKPTRIMYDTNMSWVPLMRLLENLVDQGLILAVNSRTVGRKRKPCRTFKITEKSHHILDYFSKSAEVVQTFRNSPSYPDSPTREQSTKTSNHETFLAEGYKSPVFRAVMQAARVAVAVGSAESIGDLSMRRKSPRSV